MWLGEPDRFWEGRQNRASTGLGAVADGPRWGCGSRVAFTRRRVPASIQRRVRGSSRRGRGVQGGDGASRPEPSTSSRAVLGLVAALVGHQAVRDGSGDVALDVPAARPREAAEGGDAWAATQKWKRRIVGTMIRAPGGAVVLRMRSSWTKRRACRPTPFPRGATPVLPGALARGFSGVRALTTSGVEIPCSL